MPGLVVNGSSVLRAMAVCRIHALKISFGYLVCRSDNADIRYGGAGGYITVSHSSYVD